MPQIDHRVEIGRRRCVGGDRGGLLLLLAALLTLRSGFERRGVDEGDRCAGVDHECLRDPVAEASMLHIVPCDQPAEQARQEPREPIDHAHDRADGMRGEPDVVAALVDGPEPEQLLARRPPGVRREQEEHQRSGEQRDERQQDQAGLADHVDRVAAPRHQPVELAPEDLHPVEVGCGEDRVAADRVGSGRCERLDLGPGHERRDESDESDVDQQGEHPAAKDIGQRR